MVLLRARLQGTRQPAAAQEGNCRIETPTSPRGILGSGILRPQALVMLPATGQRPIASAKLLEVLRTPYGVCYTSLSPVRLRDLSLPLSAACPTDHNLTPVPVAATSGASESFPSPLGLFLLSCVAIYGLPLGSNGPR